VANCAEKGQQVAPGSYNIEVMLHSVARRDSDIAICAAWMDSRGGFDSELTETAHRRSLDELTNWGRWADRTLVL
jgi:uncharacterized protein involved in oxidation of intracellular sulfur